MLYPQNGDRIVAVDSVTSPYVQPTDTINYSKTRLQVLRVNSV